MCNKVHYNNQHQELSIEWQHRHVAALRVNCVVVLCFLLCFHAAVFAPHYKQRGFLCIRQMVLRFRLLNFY